MNQQTKVYLTTGEFARLCKVNKRTLFHYDEIGLLRPIRIDERGYRYYSYHQLDMFLIIRILKELNIPLKEIASYLENRTAQQMIDLSKREILHIDQQIDTLHQIKRMLEDTLIMTEKGLSAEPQHIHFEHQEQEWLIRSNAITEEDPRSGYLEWIEAFRQFEHLTQSIATSFVGTMTTIEHLLSQKSKKETYFFVKANSIDTSLSTFAKRKGKYAIGFHHGRHEEIDKSYKRILHFIEEQQQTPGIFAYEEYLIDEVSVQSPEQYVTQITIEVADK
ncbi:MerR family transcriptional regulator [Paenibacillus sp. PsM32]|uniref:MerR family transcriptional regulator n=1 Tax=Paenibacillus sp. PsM32 TaxID=3030536 RepID=UPI00263AF03E|nr:MerR family transcriptional regulator [Paenibacillus sp. PsM32]MDN4620160.1 MerR family transcriptional regulator [Paenibacillus sp. PsM32]